MTEKKVQTSEKLRTAVLVSVGVVAVIAFLFLFVYLRSGFDELRSNTAEVTYEGRINLIELSSNPLVSVALQEISGRPEVLTTDPTTGSSNPELQIIEFGSFGSGYSASAQRVTEQLLEEYGDRVQLVWKDYYDSADTMALMGAEAARCAQLQSKYWEMHSAIFHTTAGFTKADLLSLAEGIGLNNETFTSCLDDHDMRSLIDQNVNEAKALNLPGTPVFFVGQAQALEGIVTYSEFEALVKQELDK